MSARIILIGGGTGVGTSRLALELAKEMDFPSIISTDTIREVVRASIHPDINPALMRSTYLAGQTANYQGKPEEVRRAEILRAYKSQCSPVWVGIHALLSRSLTENVPVVLEGVHLRPGYLQETVLSDALGDRVREYMVYIKDPAIHRNRFEMRMREAPERLMRKYLDNFAEIRWIHDYLLDRAHNSRDVVLIENGGSIDIALATMRNNL